MNREAHGASCRAAFGCDFAEVHEFLDQYATRFPREHRKLFHHRKGVALIASMFGPAAVKAAERHIMEDEGFLPDDHTFFSTANPELLRLVEETWAPFQPVVPGQPRPRAGGG